LRPFVVIDDLRNRVPELRKDEMRKLAAVGALNFIQGLKIDKQTVNRRDALWQVERVVRPAGELYEQLLEKDASSPLLPMTMPERLNADFRGTGLTIGKHPVAYHRSELNNLGTLRAIDIARFRDGNSVRVAGWVIVRQRPGTAKGFMFLSLEDETGVTNIIVTPQLFDQYRLVLVDQPFLLIDGFLQNQDNVISVKARSIRALPFKVDATPSHDFH
jgi:error-prone DNA polymerase